MLAHHVVFGEMARPGYTPMSYNWRTGQWDKAT